MQPVPKPYIYKPINLKILKMHGFWWTIQTNFSFNGKVQKLRASEALLKYLVQAAGAESAYVGACWQLRLYSKQNSFAVLFGLHVMLEITSGFHLISMMYFCNWNPPFQKEIVGMLVTSRMPVSWQISRAVWLKCLIRCAWEELQSFICCVLVCVLLLRCFYKVVR